MPFGRLSILRAVVSGQAVEVVQLHPQHNGRVQQSSGEAQVMSYGYSREDVQLALQACQQDPDKAICLLFNKLTGI